MAHLNLLLGLILPTANAVLGQMSSTAAAADTRPHGEVIWKQWKAKYSWAVVSRSEVLGQFYNPNTTPKDKERVVVCLCGTGQELC